MNSVEKRYLTVDEAAAYLSVSKSKVYKMVESNPPQIPFIPLAGKQTIRIPVAALDKYLEKQTIHPSANGR